MVLLLVFVSMYVYGQELSAPASPRLTGAPVTVFRDVSAATPMCTANSIVALIADATEGRRASAVLGLDVPDGAGADVLRAAKAIAQQWNAGDHDGALAALAGVEASVPPSSIAFSIAWKDAVPSVIQNVAAADVRVGARDSVTKVMIDRDAYNGNLVAVLNIRKPSGLSWTVNLSTDGGATWSEKYAYGAIYTVNDMSLSILRGYAYVGFTRGSLQDQVLLYRFSTTTGSMTAWPSGDFFLTTATTVAPESFKQVSLTSNDAFSAFRNRLYVATISSAHTLRFFYYPVDSSSASGITTGVTSAAQGLSISYTQPLPFMWVSYVDTLGHVCIDSINSSTNYGRAYYYASAYGCGQTSISTHRDTIFCAFDCITSFTQTLYVVRYGAGSNWRYGAFADTSLGSEAPAATLAGDAGIAVAYRYYNPTRTIRVARRDYAFGNTWSSGVTVSDYEPYPSQPAIVHMGGKKYGVLYMSWQSPVVRGAYFDTYDFTPTGVEEAPVLPDRFALEQNYPNPFNPSTTIRYSLPVGAHVSLTVFDGLGRTVAELVNGEQAAGEHVARFDGSKISSGVYYYRMQSGGFSATRKLLIVK
jgi:hypothetical protein